MLEICSLDNELLIRKDNQICTLKCRFFLRREELMLIRTACHISWQKIGEKVYIINEKSQKLLVLENVSKEIWLLILGKNELGNIANILKHEYNQNIDTIWLDLRCFVEQLTKEGLLMMEGIGIE
jgi:hypothetical protein